MVLVVGVNEREHGSLYNTQLIFDADGTLALKRRKITPTYHERMIWGQGDGSGLKVVNTEVGRVGALACWEHYNPLARFSLMAQHEQIHCGTVSRQHGRPDLPRSNRRSPSKHHALESGCFVINSTGWLTDEQIVSITGDPKMQKALRGGCYTAIISPEGVPLCEPHHRGRRHGHRRPRLRPHHQAQTHDGQRGALLAGPILSKLHQSNTTPRRASGR